MASNSTSFGNFRVDPAARELWCGERLVALPPHVFDCIAYLIEHQDRAVGRDELVSAVWGKTEISDTLLGQTMLRIRRELGDDGKEQRVVRTIPRFGFRWVAEIDGRPLTEVARSDAATVTVAETGSDSSPGRVASHVLEATPAVHVGRLGATSRFVRRFGWASLALPLAAIAALTVFLLRGAPAPSEKASVMAATGQAAAVALAELAPGMQAESSWLRFGVMDVVATRLRSSGLPTIPSENIVALLNVHSNRNPDLLRKAGDFGLLVTPRVTQTGGGWQVHLDADDGDGIHAAVDAQAGDATEAARLAADKLLAALGREAPPAQGEAEPDAQLIKRIDAAVLADDPATALSLIEQASPLQQQSPEVGLRLAKIDFRRGRALAARERLVALLNEAPTQTLPVLRAEILNGLGALAIRDDQPVLAAEYFSEAVALLNSHDLPATLGEAYLGRAAAAAEQRHFDDALSDYARARVAMRQANDTLALLRVSANEGFLDLELGRPALALPQLIVASNGFEQWGAVNEAIFTRIGQVNAHLALLEVDQAMDAADAADRLTARIESQSTLDSLALVRGKALAAAGRLREAREILMRIRSSTPPPDPMTDAAAAVQLAQIELDHGDPREALRLLDPVLHALVHPSYVRLRAQAEWIKLRALVRIGDSAAAAVALAAFESWAATDADRHARVFVELAHAECAWRFGLGDWILAFDKATATADEGAVPAEIAAVAGVYADILLAEGELAKAEVQVGRVSRWSELDFACAVLEARLFAALDRDEARQAALSRARNLAGERLIPKDATQIPISTGAAGNP